MKAVVFDMDGVLFDTEVLCMKSWVTAAREWGLPGMEEVFPQCIGLNANDSRRIVLGAYGEDFDYSRFRQETADWFKAYVEEKGLPIKPGAGEILEWLNSSGYAVGLASSTREEAVRSHLERSGFGKYFSVVVTGNMVEHPKPLPDIYLLACRRLGVDPAGTYAVEDSPNGIRSAHRAGMCPLMVPDMIPPDEEMRRLSARIFSSLQEVQTYLQEVEQ